MITFNAPTLSRESPSASCKGYRSGPPGKPRQNVSPLGDRNLNISRQPLSTDQRHGADLLGHGDSLVDNGAFGVLSRDMQRSSSIFYKAQSDDIPGHLKRGHTIR
jgi:hypothetical protein